MENPVLVEVTRGDVVESVHRGAIAIVDANAKLRASLGDIDAPIYPRSSLKPIQALPLVETGAADKFGLTEEHIALACASHSGEPMHTRPVAQWLERLRLSNSDLACGPHPPRYEPEWQAMVLRGEKPTSIHNNCSGKHTGFLTVARHWDVAIGGYEQVDHPVQQAVATTLLQLADLTSLSWGVDGCAAPNFILPLERFARALARMGAGNRTPSRSRAAERILLSMVRYPELMSGTGRACASLIRSCSGRAVVKTGAEGVYAAIVPALGLGIAIKIDDGAGRASEIAIAAILHSLKVLDEQALPTLLRAPVVNTRGVTVGERRPSATLSGLQIR